MKHVIDNRPIGSKVMFRQYHVQDNKKTEETFMLVPRDCSGLYWTYTLNITGSQPADCGACARNIRDDFSLFW